MDPDLLQKYVRQASADKVVLVQRSSGPSRLRRDERFRIEAAVYGNQSQAVMDLVSQAIASETGEEDADSAYADELADILGADLSELELDDGWVVIETASGKQSISPVAFPRFSSTRSTMRSPPTSYSGPRPSVRYCGYIDRWEQLSTCRDGDGEARQPSLRWEGGSR